MLNVDIRIYSINEKITLSEMIRHDRGSRERRVEYYTFEIDIPIDS